MNDLNSILIEGRLTRDPEHSTTPRGVAAVKFSVAVNRYRRVDDGFEEEVSFFDVRAYGKTAEWVKDKSKGDKVRVLGRLVQERWDDREGNSRSAVRIIASNLEWRKKRDGQSSSGASSYSAPSPQQDSFADDVPF